MPPNTMTDAELSELKHSLLHLLPEEGISGTLAALKKSLPENAPKFSAVFQLETRLNMANRDKIRGVLSQEQLELTYNRISADLLDLINSLELSDFSPAGSAHKSGSILYKIPDTMRVNEEKRCVVRLAFEEDVIIQNIDLVDVELKSIRVAEVMEVALIDPNETPAFSIRQINSAEQFLEKGDYTEWVYFVKPLRTGDLPLALRVSVVEVVKGRDRKKEIVLEEVVQVLSEPDNDGFEETATFKNAGYSVSYGTTSDAPLPSTETGSTIRRLSMALLILAVLGSGVWAVGLLDPVAWWQAELQGSKPAYEQYLRKFPEGRHRANALGKLDELAWQDALLVGTADAFQIYLYLYPTGIFRVQAKQKLDSLRQESPLPIDNISNSPPSVQDTTDKQQENTARADTEKPAAKPKRKPKPVNPAPLPAPVGPAVPPALPPVTEPAKPPANRRSGFEMVDVAGGTFTMGDKGGEKDECPHQVTVGNFKIGKYEVTQADWKEVMGSNPAFFKGCDECPVENVSWSDIRVFISKANVLRGAQYRLPRETEWEFAARGGKESRGYTFAGNNRAGNVAWNHNNAEQTQRVGRKRANELGIHDMSGNVWEWCLDTFQPYPSCKGKTSSDRVVRGGGWRNYEDACRVSNRNQEKPEKREYSIGFRLVQQ